MTTDQLNKANEIAEKITKCNKYLKIWERVGEVGGHLYIEDSGEANRISLEYVDFTNVRNNSIGKLKNQIAQLEVDFLNL